MMSYSLLFITVFIMFFQPTAVFPELIPYQPLRNIALIALLVYLISRKKNPIQFFSIPENRFFFLFVVVQVVSAATIWLTGGYEVFIEWLKIGIVYFLIVKICTTEGKIKWLAVAIIAGIAYLSYYSITSYTVSSSQGLRAWGYGWYDAANDIALIMVVTIPLCLLVSELSKGFMGLIFLIFAAVFGYNILITGSRNGLLGLAGVGFLSLASYTKIGKYFKIIITAIMIIMIISVGIATVLQRPDLTGLAGDDSSLNRITQWKAGLRMILAHPLFGVGPNAFGDRAAEFGGIRGLLLHNTIIQAFAETGIPGGLFFILFGFFPLKKSYDYFIKGKIYSSKISGYILAYKYLSISLVGFWICAVFSNRIMGYTLYVITALMIAARTALNEKEGIIS